METSAKPRFPAHRIDVGYKRIIPVCLILFVYTAALVFWRDRVPGFLNDTAEEALRGLDLVEGHRLEIINVRWGNPIETLYVYLVGGMAHLLGPTTLAIQLVSWVFAVACILLVWKLTEAIDFEIPPWMPVLTAACSIWLFHYARSGLRAIAGPFFLCAFALLLDRAECWKENRLLPILCGIVLGLSVYAYTACRILPLAFLAYAAFRLIRHKDIRSSLVRRYAAILVSAFLVSIPNVLFLLQNPRQYVSRGSYVFVGSASDQALNLLWSALLPFYYPNRYRDVIGPGFFFDPLSAAFSALGRNPVHIVFAVGLVIALSQARRFMAKPAFSFLLIAWTLTVLLLGAAGPSLTRLLIVLPVYLVLASLGFGVVIKRFPQLRVALPVLIFAVGIISTYSYLLRTGASSTYWTYFNTAAPSVAQRAGMLATQGHRVLCVLSQDSAVVEYLTHDRKSLVRSLDFYERPIDPRQIPFNEFRPNDLLIENIPRFKVFRFPSDWRIDHEDRFDHIYFPN